MTKPFVCALVFAASCAAQDPEPPKLSEVHVVVLDVFSQRPVESATVNLISPGMQGISPGPRQTGRTGEASFSIPRGRGYFLSVRAAGYSTATKQFTASDEKHAFTLTLGKFGKIQGQLIDTDTALPLGNIKVSARKLRYSHGRREAQGGMQGFSTDQQGRFTLERLESGDYVIETASSILSEAIDNQPDIGYPRRAWPGGGTVSDASPFRLLPGSDENVGTIKLAKANLYRLTVKPGGPLCEPGQSYRVRLSQTSRVTRTDTPEQTLRCNATATFTGLSPDTWEASIFTSFPEAMGFGRVSIVRESINTTIQLTKPASVTGRVLFDRWDNSDDTARDPVPEGLSLLLFPLSEDPHQRIAILPVLPPTGVRPDGGYEGRVYVPVGGKVEVKPFGLPKAYFLSEVRVNGRVSSGPRLDLEPYTPTAQVDVLLAPESRLEGTLHDCNCTGRIFAIPLPIATADAYPIGVIETAANAGHFTFLRLHPGKYSIVAVADTDPNDDRLEEPGRLFSLANSGKVVEVEKSRTTTVEVPLSVY